MVSFDKDTFIKKATEQPLSETDLWPLQDWASSAEKKEIFEFLMTYTKAIRHGSHFARNFPLANEILMPKVVEHFLDNPDSSK